ncbi:MAG: DUF2079 domain-containing protein, partial [Litorilinea sp.]
RALDMGNLNQAIWNTAHGNWFHLTNQPGTVNRLSLHVEPILLPIAALYRVYLAFLAPVAQTAGGPAFLVVLQSLVVALGAWPVFALARRQLGNAWLGLAFAGAFLLNPTIQAANWLEFHPVTLAPTFLLAAFGFLLARRTSWFALFAVLAASCKEEIGLLVFMQGAYALVFLPGMRRVGIITMLLAMGWSLTAVLGIQQLFADGNIHWGRYDYLGDSPPAMVWSLLSRPQVIWAQLQQAQVLRYLHELLAPVGYLPLLAPHVFLLALPSLGINLLADFPPMHQVTTLIYAAPIMPFAVLAAILGAARAQRWGQRWGLWLFARRAETTVTRATLNTWLGALIGLVIIGAALLQHTAHGYLPTGGNHRLYTVTEHHRRAANILAQIPPDAIVAAQDKLNPHVSGRETVYIYPRIADNINMADPSVGESVDSPTAPADLIWVDVTGPAWPQHPSDLYNSLQALLAGDYGIRAGEDGYLLLARDAPAKTPPPAFYDAWHAPAPDPVSAPAQLAAPIEFGDRLRLLDFAVTTDAHGEVVTRLTWQAIPPSDNPQSGAGQPDAPLGFYVAYQDQSGEILYNTEFYPPVAQLWYPTEMWSPENPVTIQTLPWTLHTPAFGLYVGVYTQTAENTIGEFLPITAGPDHLPRFARNTQVRLGGFVQAATGDWQAQDAQGMLAPGTVPGMLATAPLRPVDARFGEAIVLRGANATVQADGIHLTLHWVAQAPIAADYTVFMHVLDGAGERLIQVDDMPHDAIGPRPMTGWPVNTPIVDQRHLTLPGPRPTNGELRVQIGVYHWSDGVRLPVQGADAQPGDIVELVIVED